MPQLTAKWPIHPLQSFGIRICRVSESAPSPKADNPAVIINYWRRVIARQPWFDAEKETAIVLMLSTKYHVLGYSLVSIGSLNESIVHPREVFRPAIAVGAYGLILVHNHPSGDPGPSFADGQITERLRNVAELIQIRLVDHIIIGAHSDYFSFLAHDWSIPQNQTKSRAGRRARQPRFQVVK